MASRSLVDKGPGSYVPLRAAARMGQGRRVLAPACAPVAHTYLDTVLGASRASEGDVGMASTSLEYSWSGSPRCTSPFCRAQEGT